MSSVSTLRKIGIIALAIVFAFGSQHVYLFKQVDTDEIGVMNMVIGAAHAGCYSMFLSALLTTAGFPPTRIATTATLADALSTAGTPDPDLLIRTSGEFRISNFLLWQLAYTELYFTDMLWPDFDPKALDAAIDWYGQRERRFGRTSEQLKVLFERGENRGDFPTSRREGASAILTIQGQRKHAKRYGIRGVSILRILGELVRLIFRSRVMSERQVQF